MDDPVALIETLRQTWRGVFPGGFERGLANTVVFGAFYFLLVLAIERACRTRTGNYRTRGFAHDLVYFVYFKSGLQKWVIPAALFSAASSPLSVLELNLLKDMPFAVQLVGWLLIGDFIGYWIHRAKHYFRFLWAFHTTHHSQEFITFATNSRIHPVEDLIGIAAHVVLLRLLGADPISSFLVYFVLAVMSEIQHTQIPWRLGPFYWIVVTPPFHLYHHSTDPAHHDRNFGMVFSFWDYLFGTAVPRNTPAPTQFGLADVRPTSFWGTLVDPFRLLFKFYAPSRVGRGSAADERT